MEGTLAAGAELLARNERLEEERPARIDAQFKTVGEHIHTG